MNSIKPIYNTMTFAEVWEDSEEFLESWTSSDLYESGLVTDANIKRLFYLLFAKYGNSPIANLDVNQFCYKVYSIIFQYGPTWEKRLNIQKSLRSLSEDDLRTGGKAIYNHAYNPSSDPSTGTTTELSYINEQNTTNYKKSKLEGYAILTELLKSDVTEEFLRKFKVCFKLFVSPERPLIYETEVEEDD